MALFTEEQPVNRFFPLPDDARKMIDTYIALTAMSGKVEWAALHLIYEASLDNELRGAIDEFRDAKRLPPGCEPSDSAVYLLDYNGVHTPVKVIRWGMRRLIPGGPPEVVAILGFAQYEQWRPGGLTVEILRLLPIVLRENSWQPPIGDAGTKGDSTILIKVAYYRPHDVPELDDIVEAVQNAA